MKTTFRLISATFLFAALSLNAHGQTTIDFEDNVVAGLFENDTSGETGGPLVIEGFDGTFTKDVTFTTDSVTGFVDTSSFGLGVNSGGGDPDTESFNIAETWGVSSDVELSFVSIDIGGLQSEETFRIQSDAWINLANINPDSGAGVEFNSATGTFSLTDAGLIGDIFTLNHLTGGTDLRFESGVSVVFGNLSSTFGPNDDVEIQSLTFFAIPEPSSVIALILLGILSGVSRSRRR